MIGSGRSDVKYNLNLEHLSVQAYKALLKKQNLLPGRRVLWQDIDKNFEAFENRGIDTVEQLRKNLSTSVRLTGFAAENNVPEEYLVILKREIGSLVQKPIPLACFPDIHPALVAKLNASGLNTSKDYFESDQTASEELFCLCDLVRINGVGAIAARAFYEAGYRSVSEVAGADAVVLLERISKVNEAQHFYQAKLGLKDMQFCIDFASLLETYCQDKELPSI